MENLLEHCTLCPRRCGVNRRASRRYQALFGIVDCQRRKRFMGNINTHRRCHMMLDVPNCHPTGVQANGHVIDIGQSPRAFRDHSQQECASPIPRHINGNWPVVRIHSLWIRPVAVIVCSSCSFSAPVARLVAQVGIHFSVESPLVIEACNMPRTRSSARASSSSWTICATARSMTSAPNPLRDSISRKARPEAPVAAKRDRTRASA